MMKFFVAFLYVLCALNLFAQGPFKLSGKIEADFSQKIQVAYLDKTDSIICTDGVFSFEGQLEHPALFTLSATNLASKATVSREIFIEKGAVTLNTTFNKLRGAPLSVEFSSSQTILNNYYDRFFRLVDIYRFTMDSLVKRVNATDEDKRIAKKLAQKIYSFEEVYEKDFIFQNINNHLGAYSFYRYGVNFMEPDEIDSVYHLFPGGIKNSFYLRTVKEKMEFSRLLKEGKKFPEIILKDTRKNNVATGSMFTSKITLIDLWATWCLPCIKTHQLLKELYKKYNKSGLEIVGISIDDSRENWLKYLEKESLPWKNYIDAEGARGYINKFFSLGADNGIPFFMLVNSNGEFHKIDMDADDIEAQVKAALGL